MVRLTLVHFVYICVHATVNSSPVRLNPVVQLADSSLVEGKIVNLGPIFQIVHQFLGVPFAKPPLGW